MMAMPLRRCRIAGILTLLLALVIPIPSGFDARAATDLIVGGQAQVSDAQGDNVNLRDAPSYSGTVLTSVPEGSIVDVLDGPVTDPIDGTVWYFVNASGQPGYMISEYLVNADGAVSPAAVATTTASLNLRSGPGTNFAVLLVIPNGATVNTTGSVQNGFTQLTYNGTTGWSASQYLSISGGATPATVADGPLNLRSGPGTSFSVLTVMPTGASLTITGAQTNGFYPVSYNGTAGYAAAEFIQITSSQTATTTAGVNLRSGPGTTFSVLLVIPNGSTVTVTGGPQNGFYPVTYSGRSGFVSATYLQFGSGPVTPTPTPPTPTPTTPTTQTAWTTANLNLRSSASLSATVLLVIPNQSQITVTGSLTNGFYPVRYGTTNGFASSTYITFTPPSVTPTPTVPVGGSIMWPVSGGTWEIIQGYNGSSHQNNSSFWQYLYSLDIARVDGATAGVSVFSPVSGTVSWYERASGGITINMGNGYAFAMFHLTVDRSWEPGDVVQQGDFIGTISPPGGEGFVQVPHVHLTLWQTTDGGNFSRVATPFTGQFAISGNSFPANGTAFQWSGFEFQP
jgi:uncharacterized protein YgiM (DUF1202 family)